jgi:hypothetical protein
MAKSMIPLSSSMVETKPERPAKPAAAPAKPQAARAVVQPVEPEIPDEEAKAGQGVPLNFRVDEDFRRDFRVYAAQRGLRLNQVVVMAFKALLKAEGLS